MAAILPSATAPVKWNHTFFLPAAGTRGISLAMRFEKLLRGWGGDRGAPHRLALALEVPDSTITRLLHGQRKAGIGLALLIETATDGSIPAEAVPMTRESRRQLRQFRTRYPRAA